MKRRSGNVWSLALSCVLSLAACAGSKGVGRDKTADAGARANADASLGDAGSRDHRPTGVALCYSTLSESHAATAGFWAAFEGGKPEDRAAVVTALADAAGEHPDEEELALLNGLANLWRVAEPLPSEQSDMAGFITAATTARSELERAYALCPTDYRIPAWLGPVLVNTGRTLSDQTTIDRGLEVLQQGVDHYPAFVLFSKLLVYADRPKDDPDYQNALDAITEDTAACDSADPACSNHPRAAHNIEGASVFLGDVLAKAGKKSEALAAYAMAKGAAQYDAWDYKDLLTARIDTVDDRIAAYANTDPSDDPDAAWTSSYQCSICHKQ